MVFGTGQYELVAALPVINRGDERVRFYVILIKRGHDSNPYVTAWADSLDAPTWDNGHYFDTLDKAMESLHVRAQTLVYYD